jgi:hypothetical protein
MSPHARLFYTQKSLFHATKKAPWQKLLLTPGDKATKSDKQQFFGVDG